MQYLTIVLMKPSFGWFKLSESGFSGLGDCRIKGLGVFNYIVFFIPICISHILTIFHPNLSWNIK